MIPLMPLMALLHSLGQDNQNEVKHDHSDHMRPLVMALASSNDNSVINGSLHSLAQHDQNEMQLYFLVM